MFSYFPGKPEAYDHIKEEWLAMQSRSIITKPADKGFFVFVWDKEDYLAEGYKQLSNTSTYVEVKRSTMINY